MPLSENEILILTRLLGAREFVAAAQAEAGALGEVAVASETMGRGFDYARRRGFLMNQALFTMRRLVYGVSIAMIGGGVVAAKWGFDYNNAMQTARVALKPFFHDQTELNGALQRLWTIAKFSPFQIKDMTTAFRALYPAFSALGIPASEIIDMIQAITDGLAVAGKVTPQNLGRATLALQHMAFQGHLTGRLVNQLAQDGIPIFTILKNELGLTADQMHRIGALGIPANVAMQAIIHYMRTTPGYAGAAQRQSLHTLTGIWSTFKDNMSALMGSLEKSLFKRLQDDLAGANHWFNQFTTSVQTATNVSDFLNQAIGPRAVFFWHQFAAAVQQGWAALRTIIGVLTHSSVVWGTFLAILVLLRGALYWVNLNSQLIGHTLEIVIPLWILWHTYLKLAAIWTGILTAAEVVNTGATYEMTFAQFLLALMMGRYQIATKLATAATLIFNTVMVESALSGWTLAGTIDALLFRLKMLRLGLLGLAGLVISAVILLTLIPRAKENPDPNAPSNLPLQKRLSRLPIVGGAFSQIGHAADALKGLFHSAHVPGYQTGGFLGSGWSTVGERGPELLNWSTRQVVPAEQAGGILGGWRESMSNLRPLVVQAVLPDARVLAEAVTDVLATDGARG